MFTRIIFLQNTIIVKGTLKTTEVYHVIFETIFCTFTFGCSSTYVTTICVSWILCLQRVCVVYLFSIVCRHPAGQTRRWRRIKHLKGGPFRSRFQLSVLFQNVILVVKKDLEGDPPSYHVSFIVSSWHSLHCGGRRHMSEMSSSFRKTTKKKQQQKICRIKP